MTPTFRIIAEGADITALINDRLLLLRTTDKPRMGSDDFELRIDDRDSAVSLPSRGASIEVFLGYSGTALTRLGRYTVDEVELSGPPDTLVIRGKATVVPRADQLNESDFNFITRLASQYDCTAKVADGKLLVLQRQAGQSANGKVLDAITLIRSDLSRWQFRLADRSTHKAVNTQHQDKKNRRVGHHPLDKDQAPDGLPPAHTDRHIHPNKSAAEKAAKARLFAFNRSTAAVCLEMLGSTDCFAERSINAQGFKTGLDGEYLVDSVKQVFTQSGWITTVECNDGKQGKLISITRQQLLLAYASQLLLLADWGQRWRQHGASADELNVKLGKILLGADPPHSEAAVKRLLHDAGFGNATQFFSSLFWAARLTRKGV